MQPDVQVLRAAELRYASAWIDPQGAVRTHCARPRAVLPPLARGQKCSVEVQVDVERATCPLDMPTQSAFGALPETKAEPVGGAQRLDSSSRIAHFTNGIRELEKRPVLVQCGYVALARSEGILHLDVERQGGA